MKARFLFFGLLFMSGMLRLRSQTSVPKCLLEVFTGTWGGYTPDGAVYLEQVTSTFANAIPVNLHVADTLEISDGVTLDGFYIPSYPQALLNRVGVPQSRSGWSPGTNAIVMGTAPVAVSFDSVRYNIITRQMDIYLRANFTATLTGNFRFNCIVVEDSISSNDPAFDQVNFSNGTAGHPYYGAGNPIPGFVHRHVARAYTGGAWGTPGVIPASVSSGNTFTHHYTYTLPPYVNEDQVNLVGMVSRFDGSAVTDRPVLNAQSYNLVIPPIAGFTLSDTEICAGDTVVFANTTTGQTGGWVWDFSGGSIGGSVLANPPPVHYDTAGIYTIQLTAFNSGGSTTYTQQLMVNPVPTATYTSTPSSGAADGSATVIPSGGTPGYTYVWNTVPPQTAATATGLNAGSYTAAVTDSKGCDVQVAVMVDLSTAGIVPEDISGIQVYPNPVGDKLYIMINDNRPLSELHWYAADGRMMHAVKPVSLTAGFYEADMTGFAPGLYLLQISGEMLRVVKR